MRNVLKTLGLIAIVAIIGFAMIACNSDVGTDSPGGGGTDGGSTGGGSTGTGPIYGGGGGGGGDGGWGGGGVVGQTENGENIIVMDKETVNSNLLSIVVGEDENKTLTFKNLPAKEMPRPDDIIASGPSGNAPYGFLYRVDTVTTSGGKTVVTTIPVSLEEALKDAKVDETFPLTFEGGEKADIGDGIKVVTNPATRSVQQSSQVTSIKFEMKKEIKDTVTIEGSIELSVDVNCDIDAKWYKMERFELSAVPKLQAEVKVNIEKSLEKAWEFKIFHKKFVPITIMAGPVPIVFVPELFIDCVVSLDGKVEFEAKLLEWDYSYTFGVQYAKGKGLDAFQKNTSEPAKYLEEGFQISLSGEAKVKPKVKLMFGLYDCGWVGLSVGFYTSLKGEAGASIGSNASASIELSLHCGLELGADAKLEVLSFTIAEMDTKVFWDHDWTIWKKTLVNFQALTADGNNNTGTTKLTLTFSQEIDGLSANDITLSGIDGFISKGTLSNTGRVYTLPITISNSKGGGTLSVAVAKQGYFIMPSPKKVPFYFIPVTGVSLNETSISLSVGETKPLIATVAPPNATNKNVSYSFNYGSSFVTIGDGVVTGKAAGSAMVVFTTSDGSKTATCTITVTGSGGGGVPVTGVSLNKTSLTLSVGGTEQLIAAVAPSNATNQSVSWSSSNPGIATVSQNGTVTGVSVGESATITVTTNDGSKTASCTVTVTGSGGGSVPVTGVTLNKTSLTLSVGGTEQLIATVAPSNATNKAVTWSTSNASVASVSNGTVTGVSAGSATITVTTSDGGKTATCAVTVTGSGGDVPNNAGTNWTAVTGSIFDGGYPIWAIANGGGKFVAGVRDGNDISKKMGYSTNGGVSWTAATGITGGAQGEGIACIITYGDGRFVAGGYLGRLWSSADGVSWTTVTNDLFPNAESGGVNGIAYGDGKFVMINRDGGVYYMEGTSGGTTINTTPFFNDNKNDANGIAYGGGKFVVVGDRGKIMYSLDGATWTAVTDSKFGTETIRAIAYGGGKFVAVGNNGKMARSPDGASWTAVTDSKFGYLDDIYAIAYGDSKFVAGGQNGKIAYSSN